MIQKILFLANLTLLFFGESLSAQSTEIRGKISDERGDPLLGVHITLRGDVYGTITDVDGNFVFNSRIPPPFILHISYVGFESRDIEVTLPDTYINIRLKEQMLLGQEVVISASRIEENILRSPVSIEKMNLRDIQQVSAANFYDGLYQLKGVDMNVHGLTFRLPNTRGFNSNTNYRMNQIVDGVENIAPGMSFSAGNIFGLSPIDIESLEMVVGASTALYGPGGMNGTLVMHSKDPFRYQGLSVALQSGIMNINSPAIDHPTPMVDVNMRWAKAFSNRMAIKLTGSFLHATDWYAADFRDRTDLEDPSLTRFTNPGYDGVNTYGDETIVSVNLEKVGPQIIDGIAESQGIESGTPEYDALFEQAIQYFPDQLITRTGWMESELADTKTQNIRFGAAVHYFITEQMVTIFQANYAQGTSIYTAQNRFSARDFKLFSGKMEVNDPNFFIRAWGVADQSGSSYDIGGTALQLNERWKSSENWFTDYLAAYTQTALLTGNMQSAHEFARLVADNRDPKTGTIFDMEKPAIPVSGTEDFNRLISEITAVPVAEGGSKVFDQSKVYQIEGMYNFSHLIPYFEMQIGVSNRYYSVNSNGTVFADEPGNPITMYQLGAFIQINKNFIDDHLRLTGAFRYDKHKFFDAQYTPRFSLICFVDRNLEHSIRGTFQTAYRFPSVSSQWLDIDVGAFRSFGGMEDLRNKYNFNTIPVYPLSGSNAATDEPVTENGPLDVPGLSPEKVASTEFGYKGLFLGKKLFLDAYAFYNMYKGFEAIQVCAQLAEDAGTENDLKYRTNFTTDQPVSSFGWAIGLDYMTPVGILIRSNVAYNELIKGIDDPGVEARFNTPDYRVNFSIGHHAILPNLGFNINLRWQNNFLWESAIGTGTIPAITLLDAHISYKFSAINTVMKVGGSNLTNKYYTTSFGSAQIGGLYYVSLVYDNIIGQIDKMRN